MSRPRSRHVLRGPGAALAGILAATLVLAVAPTTAAATWKPYSASATEEGHLLTLINQLRASKGKAALTSSGTLKTEARKRSKDMYDRNYFAHEIPPDDHTVFDDLHAEGYCFSNAGENIAYNNYPDNQTTSVAFDGWKNSAGHLANMLGDYTSVGIGIFKGDGRDAGTGGAYGSGDSAAYPAKIFTAVFATPCGGGPTPTPRPTPRPTPPPTPKPTARPTAPPAATSPPSQTADVTPTEPTGASPEPTTFEFDSPLPSLAQPTGAPPTGGPGATGAGQGLQVLEPLPDQDLLDAIVAGVAGTFFGN